MKINASQTGNGMLVTDVYYEVRDSGQVGSKPIIHVCGRTEDGDRKHVIVDDFSPYFYVSEEEWVRKRDAFERELNASSPWLLDYEQGHSGIDPDTGETISLVKLVCETPYDVGRQRDNFEQTWEADVLFPYRFLVDTGVTDGMIVPDDKEISWTDVEPTDVDVKPRLCVFDLEVYTAGGGIPDYEFAEKPITAITMADTYTDEYRSFVLEHSIWDDVDRRNVRNVYDERDVSGDVNVYGDEQQLLYDAIEQIREWGSDVLTGWNSDAFDVPYLINRAFEQRCFNVQSLSPTEDVQSIDNAPRGTNYAVKGVQCFDSMTAFRKTQIHDLKSYALDNVAMDVLGWGKEDIDSIDDAWKRNPDDFVRYNLRDVEAVVGILNESEVVDTYQNIQSITGTLFGEAHFNKNIIDNLFLRKAKEMEIEA